MTPSLKNTSGETQVNSQTPPEPTDLDSFKPSPPDERIDDKAATLEDELQDLKLRFNRERFMYIFIMVVSFVLLVGPGISSNLLLGFLIAAALIFTLSMGKYLDFPWAVVPLERWHDLWFKCCEKWLLGNEHARKTEPLEEESEPPSIEGRTNKPDP